MRKKNKLTNKSSLDSQTLSLRHQGEWAKTPKWLFRVCDLVRKKNYRERKTIFFCLVVPTPRLLYLASGA